MTQIKATFTRKSMLQGTSEDWEYESIKRKSRKISKGLRERRKLRHYHETSPDGKVYRETVALNATL